MDAYRAASISQPYYNTFSAEKLAALEAKVVTQLKRIREAKGSAEAG